MKNEKQVSTVCKAIAAGLIAVSLLASCSNKGYHRNTAKVNWKPCGAGQHSLRISK